MWLGHRGAGVLKKSLWSVMLLVPLFGWLMYAAFFQPPELNELGRECSDS